MATYTSNSLLAESQEAIEQYWFVQRVEITEQTDRAISLRLLISSDLFVQAFVGDLSGSLYFALVEDRQRLFGIDRQYSEWHMHPFGSVHEHVPLDQPLEPKPLLKFLKRVENLLLEHELL